MLQAILLPVLRRQALAPNQQETPLAHETLKPKS